MKKRGKFISLDEVEGSFRKLLVLFVLCLSMGYLSGVYYVSVTSGFTGNGIEENYLGNEEDDDAETMKFKMHEKEILSIIHSHTIIFSFIFMAMAMLLLQTNMHSGFRSFLIVEPFISILITFGGIWLLWLGFTWMKYFVILSGALMHSVYFLSAFLVLKELIKKRKSASGNV